MKLPFDKIISEIEETDILAEKLSRQFISGDIVVLNGNLGTGKTTLIKSICRNYNITNVNSPTFSIVNEYSGDQKIYHFDFYRLEKVEELYDIGFEDYLNDDEAIIFIEWGNLMQHIIPSSHYEIELSFSPSNTRHAKIVKNN